MPNNIKIKNVVCEIGFDILWKPLCINLPTKYDVWKVIREALRIYLPFDDHCIVEDNKGSCYLKIYSLKKIYKITFIFTIEQGKMVINLKNIKENSDKISCEIIEIKV